MKKLYIQPQTTDVTALLGADILEGGDTLGGQSHNPVDKNGRDDVDYSGKQNPFFEDDEDGWSKSTNVWE